MDEGLTGRPDQNHYQLSLRDDREGQLSEEVSWGSQRNSDIDDLLNDIPVDNDLIIDKDTKGDSASVVKQATGKKCLSIYVGGSSHPRGVATIVTERCCDHLRCTSCDFKVVTFDDFEWHSSVDYLFLRNHVPDFDRLRSKLKTSKGSRAYCCQCSSRTFKHLSQLNDPQLKWVCGKH